LSIDVPNAFFSYSREDSQFALRLAEDLKAGGANVWLDQLDIEPGQRWARAVEEALNNSPRLIVILTPTSATSTNVQDEVNFALEEHKTIIPVMYRDCKVPFQLRPFQYVDFRTDYAHGLSIMLRTLGVAPGKAAVAAGPATSTLSGPGAVQPQPAAGEHEVPPRVEPSKQTPVIEQRAPVAAPNRPAEEQQAFGQQRTQWEQSGAEAERSRVTREPAPPPADDFAERRRAQEAAASAAAQRPPLPQPPPTAQPPVQSSHVPAQPPQTGFATTGNKIGLAAAGLVIVILICYWVFHPSPPASDTGKTNSSLNAPAEVKPAEPPPQDNNPNANPNATNSEPAPATNPAPTKPGGREARLKEPSPNATPAKIKAAESSGSGGMPSGVDPKFADLYHKAQQGDTTAMVQIGYNYGTGKGVPVDYKKASAWYRKAADGGSAHAMYDLGVLYQNGLGVKKDYRQAFELYQKAADAGDRDAMDNVGFLYQNGWGVTRDYDQAATWYRKAADAGNPNAMANLSVLYQNGQGVSQDYKQAFFWDRKAAEAGIADAMLGLGVLYENGRGVTQDYAQAINWYTKAADAGQSMGTNNLAVLYEMGKGVPKDQDKAIALYRKAAKLGNPKAKENLSRLGVSP